MSSKFPDIVKLLDTAFSQARILNINGRRYVYKSYNREVGIIKWFFIKVAGITTKVYPYTADPLLRMKRELEFIDELKDYLGLPRVILRDWIGKSIVREYVEGVVFDPVSDPIEYRHIGELLARIHSYGYALGDTKFQNFVKTSDGYIVVDSEQAIKTSDYGFMYWDIIVFTVTSIYGFISKKPLRALVEIKPRLREFLGGYIERGGSLAETVLKCYTRFNYRGLVYILLPTPYNIQYFRVIEELL
ncbi:MAG: serine/threonine protein kinase [Thermoprotei archaeon]